MKPFTKYDVADLVLVCTGIVFLLKLIDLIVAVGFVLGMESSPNLGVARQVSMMTVNAIILVVLNYALFFKRPLLIRLLFPGSGDSTVEFSEGLTVLTQFSFWVRLLGVITFLWHGVSFFSIFIANFAAGGQFTSWGNWWMQGGSQSIATVAGLLIIWEADWISDRLERFGASVVPVMVNDQSEE